MDCLRTPEPRFAGLPGYEFEPHYLEVGGLRIHHLDEGPRDGPSVLLLHGEPSWSYLYRTLVGPLVGAGLRVVVPDLVGFGRSDKPTRREDYSYARQVSWMRSVVEALDLKQVTLFGQDWGGLIGCRLVAEDPGRYARVVMSNTGFPTGDQPMGEAFLTWQRFSQEVPNFPVGAIVAGGCRSNLTPEVIAAYDAPFPDETYKAGPRQFPLLVPTRPDDPASAANRSAWAVLATFAKPWLCAYSDQDPITGGADRSFLEAIPGARGREHVTIEGAGHFLQEDAGQRLAEVLIRFVRSS